MRKCFALMAVLVYLFAFTEVRQVLKIPALVEHYVTHTQKDGGTTVLSFLKMHYLDPPVKDADWREDMKLPFKTPGHSPSVVVIQIPPKAVELPFPHKLASCPVAQNYTYTEKFFPSVIQRIWQPPKI